MTKKTPYEKRETEKTKATFSVDEVLAFATDHSAFVRRAYLEKMKSRPRNPRLDENGSEVLSPISLIADLDMRPLSTRENLARFQKMPSILEGDGLDQETDTDERGRPVVDDRDYYVPDPNDTPPSPHELRARQLGKRLSKARAAHVENLNKFREDGETLPHKPSAEGSGERPQEAGDPPPR